MAWFFSVACGVDSETEIIDSFAERYGWTVTEIGELDTDIAYHLLAEIKQKNREKRAWEQWLELLPYMVLKYMNFIEYEDFKNRLCGSDIDTRPIEEIMADVEEVRKYIG